eukprot:UN02743
MLTDFVDLKPGDTVIQNCANSAVGEAAIQFLKAKGCHSINIIRDRENLSEVADRLKEIGADIVISDTDLAKGEKITQVPQPKLGLNATCGKISTDMIKLMGKGSTLVTYGGMSKRPIMVGAASFIFKDITLKGYWQTRWTKSNTEEERLKMFDENR